VLSLLAQTRKVKLFKKRSLRVRNKLKKTGYGKCRLSVHRSSKNIYAQVIDDRLGATLASVSSLEKSLGVVGKNNIEVAAKLGKEIASRAIKKGIKEVVFDRGGLLYHGKVKALADAARENGLKL
jgi:large subunit ribosomal protein L18